VVELDLERIFDYRRDAVATALKGGGEGASGAPGP
jgi:hypothetical protein